MQPRDFYLHYIYVPVKRTTIRWTFTTKKNNIAFGLYKRLGHTPLPSSSDIVLKAQQARSDQLLKAYPLSKKTGIVWHCLSLPCISVSDIRLLLSRRRGLSHTRQRTAPYKSTVQVDSVRKAEGKE